jgi:hypothetical protein
VPKPPTRIRAVQHVSRYFMTGCEISRAHPSF